MARKRHTIRVDEEGRLVLPAAVRDGLRLDHGGLLILEAEVADDEMVVQLHGAADVAGSGRGFLRDLAPEEDLAAELMADRRRSHT